MVDDFECLKRLGFEPTHPNNSHVVKKKTISEGQIGCVVPIHRELKIGTLSGILKQAKVSPQEFIDRL